MIDTVESHRFARKVAVSEERTNTKQADPSATLERLRTSAKCKNAESADRIMTATKLASAASDRMATLCWWHTAVTVGAQCVFAAVITAAVG